MLVFGCSQVLKRACYACVCVRCGPCTLSLPSLAALWAGLCQCSVSVGVCWACVGAGSHSITHLIKSPACLYTLHFHGKKTPTPCSLRLCSWRFDLSFTTSLSHTAHWKHSVWAVCSDYVHALKFVNYSSTIPCLVKCMVITLGDRGAVLRLLLLERYWSLCSFKSLAGSL